MTDADEEFAGDLRTTYVSNLDSGVFPDEEDLVLGVIRYNYDFVERTVDRNCPALAPPKKLLRHYKNAEEKAESDDDILDPDRVAWHTVSFRDRYLGYLERPGPQACIEELRERLDDGRTVWLVCLEADDTFCHRRLLAARVRGSSPTHWSELHEIPKRESENDDEDRPTTATLGDFSGGGTA